jgi:hypothetical protein
MVGWSASAIDVFTMSKLAEAAHAGRLIVAFGI